MLQLFLGKKESARIDMYDNTKVTCTVTAFDADFENVVVQDLITPLPVPIDRAVLRTSDIISMNIDYQCQ